jgi:hypothetical protein
MYARKSLIVHINWACITKFVLVDASNVRIPTFHSSYNSSIKGCTYTSISIPGEFGPEIIRDSMKDVCFMHIQRGKLYGTIITG